MICIIAALLAGFIVAVVYKRSVHATGNLTVTLALLPAVTTMVIMMVNGNLGVGVAVAGSFSLVRFRSIPGKASDIVILFLAMGLGLCTGMGYVAFAVIMAVILSLVFYLLNLSGLGENDKRYRSLRVTIPEDLDYTNVFDEIFDEYTSSHKETAVKTANLGTMYQISYDIVLKDPEDEKKLIDALRMRNGNLPVIAGSAASVTESM
jgi:hypothetical protein